MFMHIFHEGHTVNEKSTRGEYSALTNCCVGMMKFKIPTRYGSPFSMLINTLTQLSTSPWMKRESIADIFFEIGRAIREFSGDAFYVYSVSQTFSAYDLKNKGVAIK